ncbi:MAG: hypothetical protein ACOX4B_06280 [Bacillota bacterium]
MPKTPFELSENTTFKAVLVGIHDHKAVVASKDQMFSWKESMRELARLAETLDFEVVAQVTQEREAPDPATYVGKGKARELLGDRGKRGCRLRQLWTAGLSSDPAPEFRGPYGRDSHG